MVVKATYALAVLRNRNMHKKFRSHLQKKPRKVGSVCVSKVKKIAGWNKRNLRKKKKSWGTKNSPHIFFQTINVKKWILQKQAILSFVLILGN